MSHEPPVPPGNQSPFPVQAPPQPPETPATPPLPLAAADPVPPAIVAATTPLAPAPVTVPAAPKRDNGAEVPARGLPLGRMVGAAAGAGALVFGIAALLFPRAEAKPKKRKRRKT